MEFLLFLSGPITGVSYAESTEWREYIGNSLRSEIKALSPMRGKSDLAREKKVAMSYEDRPLSSAAGITCRDHNDVKRCDMVFVNVLGAKEKSAGTIMEIAWAHAYGKPIVLVMEKEGNLHDHAMIRQVCGFVVDDLDQAVEIVHAVLLPGV